MVAIFSGGDELMATTLQFIQSVQYVDHCVKGDTWGCFISNFIIAFNLTMHVLFVKSSNHYLNRILVWRCYIALWCLLWALEVINVTPCCHRRSHSFPVVTMHTCLNNLCVTMKGITVMQFYIGSYCRALHCEKYTYMNCLCNCRACSINMCTGVLCYFVVVIFKFNIGPRHSYTHIILDCLSGHFRSPKASQVMLMELCQMEQNLHKYNKNNHLNTFWEVEQQNQGIVNSKVYSL